MEPESEPEPKLFITFPQHCIEPKERQQKKQVLKMFYFDEMQANEISEKLNVPINTIKTRLLRGRNKIKSLLQEDMVLSTL